MTKLCSAAIFVLFLLAADSTPPLADRLAAARTARGAKPELIGGARLASELDAMRAIDEGTRVAWSIG